ncbi:MAG: S-layer homology domain-containing protein, partial [Candidatus Margulisiibacteriota bacterium]
MKRFIYLLLVLFLFSSIASAQFVAIDPTRNIPNARVLGLGKAYIGLANDAGSIFTNPAGLAEAENWQLTSMSGNFLEEYTYLSFSGFYPTQYGVFGVGYAGYFIGGAYATTIEAGSDPADPIYTFDFSQPVMENRNTAVVLSYANELKKINYLNQLPWADRISFGTNVKLFNASLTGDGIQSGAGIASGTELDIGMKLQPPQPWLKFGAAVQNILPMSLGGKLSYASGHEESYPAVLEVGSVIQLFGEEDAIRQFRGQDVKVMIDFDMHPTMSDQPLVWHIGTEWKPIPLLALRAAIDQDAGGSDSGEIAVYSDTCFGVGLNLGGLNFDYAYHTFVGAPNVDNHYFSLSYSLPKPKAIDVPIKILEPADKLITFESKVKLVGEVLHPDIKTVRINDIPIKVGLRGEFSTFVALKEGKNKLVIKGYSGNKKEIGDVSVRILRLITFPDVATDYWVAVPISLLAMDKVITGYPDGTFKPEGNITRAEMCTLIMKSQGVTGAGRMTVFPDVQERHWASAYIAEASKQEIVLGYPDGTFKPKDNITRA